MRIVVFAILLLSSCAARPVVREAETLSRQKTEIVYEFEATKRYAEVRSHFALDPPYQARICMPAAGSREGEKLTLYEFIVDGERGEPSPDRYGCFSLPAKSKELDMSYKVEATYDPAWHPSALSPQRGEDFLFFPAASLIPQILHPPSLAQAETKIRTKRENGIFYAGETGNQKDFFDGFLAFSNAFHTFSAERDGHGLSIASTEAYYAAMPELTLEILGITEALKSWVRLPESMSILILRDSDPDRLTGYANQNRLFLLLGENALRDLPHLRRLIAHELFHLVNGEGIRFEDKHTLWFKEGMTHYASLMLLKEAGLISDRDTCAIVGEHMSNYGQSVRHPSQMHKDPQFPYDHGFFLSMLIDTSMRKNAGKNIREFWQNLSRNRALRSNAIDNRMILDLFNEFSSYDFGDIFDNHIFELHPLDSASIVRESGICELRSRE